MPIVRSGILKFVDSKRVNLSVNTKTLMLKEEKVEGGVVVGFGEDAVLEVTNYFVGDYWVCLYTKIQKTSQDNADPKKAEYYYKLKCFSPLRSNSRLEHIYTSDEDKMKDLCMKEITSYVDRLSGNCQEDDFYKIMEREIVNMVEQRSFALDNEEDFKSKFLE